MRNQVANVGEDVLMVQADVVFCNANVVPHVDGRERAGYVAVTGERIRTIGPGDGAQISCKQRIDLGGATVIPGLMDSHVHLMSTGLAMTTPEVMSEYNYDRLAEICSQVVTDRSDHDMILIYGLGIRLIEPRPTREMLDEICDQKPLILLDRGGHGLCLNTAAARWAAESVKHMPTDQLNDGLLTGAANTWLRNEISAALPDQLRFEAFHAGAKAAARVGLTTVHALEGGEAQGKACFAERDAESLLEVVDELPIRALLHYQTTNVDRVCELGLPRVGGCLWIDGSYGEYTAALFEPYADRPDTKGVLYFTDQELHSFMSRAHSEGLQIIMHAIGDRAIEQLVNAYEQVLTANPRADHRHRIEHFSLPLPHHIDKVIELGLHLGMQPIFASRECSAESKKWLGAERFANRHPYKKILDAGIVVGAGSDSEAMPLDPMIAIDIITSHPDRQRRLTPQEAFKLFTYNNAVLGFEERDKGSLEVGKLADMTVLNGDPFVQNTDLGQIKAIKTIVGGNIVFDNDEEGC